MSQLRLLLVDPAIDHAKANLSKARRHHHGQAKAFRELALAVARAMKPEIAEQKKQAAEEAGKVIVQSYERRKHVGHPGKQEAFVQ